MEEEDKLPILIINYNTPDMVYYNILSINKTTPNCLIYVFDNSDDGTRFEGELENVIILDNTKNQYFDRYEKDGYYKQWSGSIMHAKTIQTCIYTIDEEGIVLLDSDVLVTKNLMELYNPEYVFVGDLRENGRANPQCCFINLKMCRDNNIKFYEFGTVGWNCELGIMEDTGFYFSKNFKESNLPYKDIDCYRYIRHFSSGSWNREHKSYEEFLKENEKYWR